MHRHPKAPRQGGAASLLPAAAPPCRPAGWRRCGTCGQRAGSSPLRCATAMCGALSQMTSLLEVRPALPGAGAGLPRGWLLVCLVLGGIWLETAAQLWMPPLV